MKRLVAMRVLWLAAAVGAVWVGGVREANAVCESNCDTCCGGCEPAPDPPRTCNCRQACEVCPCPKYGPCPKHRPRTCNCKTECDECPRGSENCINRNACRDACRGREAANKAAAEATRKANEATAEAKRKADEATNEAKKKLGEAANEAKKKAEVIWKKLVDAARKPVDTLRKEIERKLPTNASLLDAAKSTATEAARTLVNAAIDLAKQVGGGALGVLLKDLRACFDTKIEDIITKILGGAAQGASNAFADTAKIMKPVTDFISTKVTAIFTKLKGDIERKINDAKSRFKTAQDEHQNNGWNKIQATPPDLRWLGDRAGDSFKTFVKAWNDAERDIKKFKTDIGNLITTAETTVKDLKTEAASKATPVINGMKQVAGSASPVADLSLDKILAAARKYSKDAIAMVKCLYNFGKKKLGATGLPDFDQIKGGIEKMLEYGGKLFDKAKPLWEAIKNPNGPGARAAFNGMKQEAERIGKELMEQGLAAAAKGIPGIMKFVTEAKTEIRSVLVIEGVKSVFDADGKLDGREDSWFVDVEGQVRRPNQVIDNLYTKFSSLITDPIGEVANKLGMKSFVMAAVNVIDDPLKKGFRVALRALALVRTVLKKPLEIILPLVLKGGNTFIERVKRVINKIKEGVPPSVAELAETGIGVVIDIVTPLAAFLAESLGIQDVVMQVLNAIVGGFEDLEGLKTLKTEMKTAAEGCKPLSDVCPSGKNCDPVKVRNAAKACDGGKVVQAHGDSASDEKARAVATRMKAEADALLAKVIVAQEEKLDAEKKLVEALAGIARDLRAPSGAQKTQLALLKRVVNQKRTKFEDANKAYKDAVDRAKHFDPDAAQKSIVIAGWEKISEAFMKLTWDVFMAIYTKVVDAYLSFLKIYVGVMAGAVGTALHVATYTVTWTPWIPTIVGWAVNLCLALYQTGLSMFFALVLPEFRTLAKDQLVSVRTQFVGMFEDENKRKTIQESMELAKDIAASLGPIIERMKSVRDKMAMGSSALMTGPIGDVLKQLPPELVAAMTKAISQGIKALQKMGTAALTGALTSMVSGGGSVDLPKPGDVAKMIVKVMKQPLIDFFVGMLPGESPWRELQTAVKRFLETALSGVEDDPVKAVNPSEILARIGTGILDRSAQDAFAEFLVAAGASAISKMADVGNCFSANEDGSVPAGAAAAPSGGAMVVLKALVKKKVEAVANMLAPTPDFSKIPALLGGGVFGLLREVVHGTKGFLTCLMVKQIPDNPAALKEKMRKAIDGAFMTVENRGEFERVVGKGWKGIVARVVELSREPAVELLLKDIPDGKAKAAVRSAIVALGAESKVEQLLVLISKGGFPGVLGEVLKTPEVATAIAELILGDIADSNTKTKVVAKLTQRGTELAANPGSMPQNFLQQGLGDVMTLAAEPLEAWMTAQVTAEVTHPALKAALIAAIKKGREELMSGNRSLAEVVKSVAGLMLARLKAYLVAVKTKIAGKGYAAVENLLQMILTQTMARIPDGTAASASAAIAVGALIPSLLGDLKQLGAAMTATQGFTFPAEVTP